MGLPVTYVTAKDLIDQGLATDVTVVPIFLNQRVKVMKYHDEVTHMKEDLKRREWLKNFIPKLRGLTIALYAHTEHGQNTWASLSNLEATSSNLNDFELMKSLGQGGIFFMSGSTKAKTRQQILEYLKNDDTKNAILIGQKKILSTGINIKKLRNLVFLSSSKSYIEVIQSIGRVLRLHPDKKNAIIFDIVDDYTKTKKGKRKTENHGLRHFYQRLSYYQFQGFPIKEREVDL